MRRKRRRSMHGVNNTTYRRKLINRGTEELQGGTGLTGGGTARTAGSAGKKADSACACVDINAHINAHVNARAHSNVRRRAGSRPTATRYQISLIKKSLTAIDITVSGISRTEYEASVRVITDVGRAVFQRIPIPAFSIINGRIELRQILNTILDLASSAQLEEPEYIQQVWGIRNPENVESDILQQAHEYYVFSKRILRKLRTCGIPARVGIIDDILDRIGKRTIKVNTKFLESNAHRVSNIRKGKEVSE